MSDLDLPNFLPDGLAELSAYVPPEGQGGVRLDANEYPFQPDAIIMEEIGKAIGGVSLNRYPDPASSNLRRAFAERFGCLPENVMAGNGSDELIGYLIWTLRGNRRKGTPSIIVPVPTFAMYSIAALAAGCDVQEVPLGPDLEPDMDAILNKTKEKKPSIVFISNPNNPTGTSYSRDLIHALLKVSNGLVVVDEAYGDYSGEASWISEVGSVSNLAVLRTLSKVGAAGIRCGFLTAGKELLDEVNKIRFPFNMSTYSQTAGEIFLRHYDRIRIQADFIIEERGRLSSELTKSGVKVFPSQGNFLLAQCNGKEKDLWLFLQGCGIVIKFLACLPVTGDALRITVGMKEENDLLISKVRSFFTEGGKDAQG